MRNKWLSFVLLSALMMAGCVRVGVSVSSFSNIPPTNNRATFYIFADETQDGSLEFYQYAESVAKRLAQGGWQRVPSPEAASYIVVMNYGVSGSSESISSAPVYGWSGGGTTTYSGSSYGSGGYSSHSGTAHTMGTFGVVGSSTSSTTQYHRYFNLQAIDKETLKPVFETKASSSGSSGTFGQVAECIFDLALKDFPAPQRGLKRLTMSQCGKAAESNSDKTPQKPKG